MSYLHKVNLDTIKHNKTMLLFIYGSLKKGFTNHHMMQDSKYKATATTIDKHAMFQEQGACYPYLVNSTDERYHHIEGELYEVDYATTLKLDIFEDAPSYYYRDIIEVETSAGVIEKAQVYFIKDTKIPVDQEPLSKWIEDDSYFLKQFEDFYKATA